MSAETSQDAGKGPLTANFDVSQGDQDDISGTSSSPVSSDIYMDVYSESSDLPKNTYMTLPSISPLKAEISFPTEGSFPAALGLQELLVPSTTLSGLGFPSGSRSRPSHTTSEEVKKIFSALSENIAHVRSCSPNPQSSQVSMNIVDMEGEMAILQRKQTLRELLQILPLNVHQQVTARTPGEASSSRDQVPLRWTATPVSALPSSRVLFSHSPESKRVSKCQLASSGNTKRAKTTASSDPRLLAGNGLLTNGGPSRLPNEVSGFNVSSPADSRNTRLFVVQFEHSVALAELQALAHRDMMEDLATYIVKEYNESAGKVNFDKLLGYRLCFDIMVEEDSALKREVKDLQSSRQKTKVSVNLDRVCRLHAENQKYIAQVKKGFFMVNIDENWKIPKNAAMKI